MYNRIILVGRLVRDPDIRHLQSGDPVATFTIAVTRPMARDGQGRTPADFIDVVAWRTLADQVSQFMTKGRLVLVEGRLQIRSYDDRNGIRRKASEVIASRVAFLDKARQTDQAPAPAPEAPEPDGLPDAPAEPTPLEEDVSF